MARWIAVAMLGVCPSAEATSYYVSNSGWDNNNGTSAATPWQTFKNVNGGTFHGATLFTCNEGECGGNS